MIAAALFSLCQCLNPQPISSSADVGQDSSSLYVVDTYSMVQRISKATGDRTTITPPATRHVTAIDADGETVYFGTSTSIGGCSWVNNVGGCTDDGQSLNEIRAVPISGGTPVILAAGLRSVMRITHDAAHIYWVEASSRIDTPIPTYPADARIRRMDKRSLAVEAIADGLTIPYYEPELVALDGSSIYYVGADRHMYRYNEDSGMTTPGPEFAGPILIDETYIYAGDLVQAKSDRSLFELPLGTGIGYVTVIGVGGGHLLYSRFYASGRTTFGDFYLYDYCKEDASPIGHSNSPGTAYAIDSCAVYTGVTNWSPVCAPVPVRITSIDLSSSAPKGGVPVTITGSGFLTSATVDIGGRAAAIVSLTPTRIELIVPANKPGSSWRQGTFLRVHNGDGTCGAVPFFYFQVRSRVVAH